jgi:predicted acylesterase/phospholipase RssA
VTVGRDVGVALSGGGHRATVFGLGALLALRDAGVHERIVSISSVSGGSIANGAVMVGPDFGTAPPDKVDAHIAAVVDRVAKRGVLQGGAPATRWYLRLLVLSGLAAVLGLVVAILAGLAGWPKAILIAGTIVFVAGLLGAWLLFGQRSARTEKGIDTELLGGTSTTLADQRARDLSIHHVICTTEVQGGVEFFFSNRMVYGWNFSGSTAPCRLPLSTPVQASACVPGAFRTRRIPLDVLGVTCVDRSRRRSGPTVNVDDVVLQDGGVYDNMADEWEYNFRGRVKVFSELGKVQPTPARSLVIVNASAGWSALRPLTSRGPKFEIDSLMRANNVQYDVSTSHRRRALFQRFSAHQAERELDGVFVQIADSPYTLARSWLPTDGHEPDAAGRRALDAIAFLDAYGIAEDEWDAVAARSAAVPTTLKPLGTAASAELLEHGYVLTLVNAHVLLGFGDLETVAKRNRFERAKLKPAPA